VEYEARITTSHPGKGGGTSQIMEVKKKLSKLTQVENYTGGSNEMRSELGWYAGEKKTRRKRIVAR